MVENIQHTPIESSYADDKIANEWLKIKRLVDEELSKYSKLADVSLNAIYEVIAKHDDKIANAWLNLVRVLDEESSKYKYLSLNTTDEAIAKAYSIDTNQLITSIAELHRREHVTRDLTGSMDLEKLLKSKPAIDMDVIEFLTISGLYYHHNDAIYLQRNREIMDKPQQIYDARRATLARHEKVLESRLTNSLISAYFLGQFKTLRELKNFIEKYGVKPVQRNFYGLSYNGITRFNEVLGQYGIEPIAIRKP